jgi:DNA-binding CsgD family transcriptional regulator
MITAQDTALLLAISEAAGANGSWPKMLRAFCDYLRADAARFYVCAQAWSETGPIDDPLPEIYSGLRLGRVYTGEELAARTSGPDSARMPFDQRLIAIAHPNGTAWLIFSRARDSFRAIDTAALASFAPHVARAITLSQEFATLEAAVSRSQQLLRRLGVGVVQWNGFGKIEHCDSVAQDIIGALPQGGMRPSFRQGITHTHLAPGIEMLSLWDDDGRCIGVLRNAQHCLPKPDILSEILGLTRTEARLVYALGQGDSLAEAAARLGLTIETARYYSKQIFSKTGLRGQTDLIRYLWAGVLMLSPK